MFVGKTKKHGLIMKMLSKEILDKTWAETNAAYNVACEKVGYSNAEIRSNLILRRIKYDEFIRKRDKLDEVYRELLCKLPTEVLNNVVDAWKSKQQSRSIRTIETIAAELFERELGALDGT